MPLQSVEIGLGAKGEDARIPRIGRVGDVPGRGLRVRFLHECRYLESAVAARLAAPQVAVSRLGTRRPDADGDELPLAGGARRRFQYRPEDVGPGDVMVAGEDEQHRLG